MKLISQIVIAGLAIALVAGLMIPAIEEAIPGQSGPIVIDGKNDNLPRYAKISNFSVTVDSNKLTLTTSDISGYTYEIPDGADGWILGDKFQFYHYVKSGNHFVASFVYDGGTGTPKSASNSLALKYDSASGTISAWTTAGATGTATYSVDVGKAAYIYVPYAQGQYVRSDGTDGAIFDTKDKTVDGGVVGSSPRGFFQIQNGTLNDTFVGGNSGAYAYTAPDWTLKDVWNTTLAQIENNTIEYTATDGTSGTLAIGMWFMPYTYHYEGEGQETTALGNLFGLLPILAIVGILVGAVGYITGRGD